MSFSATIGHGPAFSLHDADTLGISVRVSYSSRLTFALTHTSEPALTNTSSIIFTDTIGRALPFGFGAAFAVARIFSGSASSASNATGS